MTAKFILIALSFVVLSCADNTTEKPKKLIDQQTMEKIIYDLSMLQAIKGHNATLLPKNSINPKTYIYQKYKVDSAQFAQSNTYYSSNITLYKKMFDNVIAKMTLDKKVIDKKVVKDERKKINDSIKKIDKTKTTTILARG